MDEIFRLTDRITVFKNGQTAGTVKTADVDKDAIISMMTDNWVSEKLTVSRKFGEVLLDA